MVRSLTPPIIRLHSARWLKGEQKWPRDNYCSEQQTILLQRTSNEADRVQDCLEQRSAARVHQPKIEFGRSVGPKIAERFVVCGLHPVARNGHVHPGHAALRSRHNGIDKFDAATKTLRLDDVFVSGIAVAKMYTDLD